MTDGRGTPVHQSPVFRGIRWPVAGLSTAPRGPAEQGAQGGMGAGNAVMTMPGIQGFGARASRVSRAGPRPPVRRMPWQEPQSWRTMRTSLRGVFGAGAGWLFARRGLPLWPWQQRDGQDCVLPWLAGSSGMFLMCAHRKFCERMAAWSPLRPQAVLDFDQRRILCTFEQWSPHHDQPSRKPPH